MTKYKHFQKWMIDLEEGDMIFIPSKDEWDELWRIVLKDFDEWKKGKEILTINFGENYSDQYIWLEVLYEERKKMDFTRGGKGLGNYYEK